MLAGRGFKLGAVVEYCLCAGSVGSLFPSMGLSEEKDKSARLMVTNEDTYHLMVDDSA